MAYTIDHAYQISMFGINNRIPDAQLLCPYQTHHSLLRYILPKTIAISGENLSAKK